MDAEFVRVAALRAAAEKGNFESESPRIMQQTLLRSARVEDHGLVRAENDERNSADYAMAVVGPLDFLRRELVFAIVPCFEDAAAIVAGNWRAGEVEGEGGAHMNALGLKSHDHVRRADREA